MRDELEAFVASLAIPEDRKAVVLAELLDHVACAAEAATRDGRDPEAASRDALGNLEALRRSLEAVEPAFRISRAHAMIRGLVAAGLVALLLDRGGAATSGILGAIAAVAITAVAAPPRLLELLRAELRAPRVRGLISGPPIGPAITYLFTVLAAPLVVWIAMIAYRAPASFETPPSAFAVAAVVWGLMLVEGIRARHRRAIA